MSTKPSDRGLLEKIPGRDALDRPDHSTTRILGQGPAQHMDMVTVKDNIPYVNVVAVPEARHGLQDQLFHDRIKRPLPVLYRQLDVMVALRHLVVPTPIPVRELDQHTKTLVPCFARRQFSPETRAQGVDAAFLKDVEALQDRITQMAHQLDPGPIRSITGHEFYTKTFFEYL